MRRNPPPTWACGSPQMARLESRFPLNYFAWMLSFFFLHFLWRGVSFNYAGTTDFVTPSLVLSNFSISLSCQPRGPPFSESLFVTFQQGWPYFVRCLGPIFDSYLVGFLTAPLPNGSLDPLVLPTFVEQVSSFYLFIPSSKRATSDLQFPLLFFFFFLFFVRRAFRLRCWLVFISQGLSFLSLDCGSSGNCHIASGDDL